MTFALRVMDPASSQFFIVEPKHRLLSNHLWNLGELLEKQAADTRTSGVVGKIGRNTPMNAIIKEIIPVMKKIIRSISSPLTFIFFSIVI